jgi:hypothetical protein
MTGHANASSKSLLGIEKAPPSSFLLTNIRAPPLGGIDRTFLYVSPQIPAGAAVNLKQPSVVVSCEQGC